MTKTCERVTADRTWMRRVGCIAAACLVLALAGTATTMAQTPAPSDGKAQATGNKPTARTHPNNPMLWDLDAMMEDAVTQITRRYNLSEQQEAYTRILLKTRTREFLADYEDEVRQLLMESAEFRTGQKAGDSETLKQWADRARPVYDAAMTAILDGNEEWGQILDDDQKKIHARDLDRMKANQKIVQSTLDKWSAGEGELPARVSNAVRQTRKISEGGQVSQQAVAVVHKKTEEDWSAYVELFIRVYKLTEEQANSAREKVLKEQLKEARGYRETNKDRFDRIERELEKIDPKLPANLRGRKEHELRIKKIRLERPIRIFFKKLHNRLEGLLDSKQRAAADPKDKEQLRAVYENLAKMPEIPQMPGKSDTKLKPDVPAKTPQAGEATTQPASSEKPAKAEEKKPAPASQSKSDETPKSDTPTDKPAKASVPAKESETESAKAS